MCIRDRCITDRDQVVAAAGGAKKDFFQKPISRALEHVIQERMTVQAGKGERAFTPVTDDDGEGITAQVITPIICEGDAIGAVIVMSRDQMCIRDRDDRRKFRHTYHTDPAR